MITEEQLQSEDVREFIAREIRLAMQQEMTGRNAMARTAIADVRAGRIISYIKGWPLTNVTTISQEQIDATIRMLKNKGEIP